jgi:hypothetical protein
MFASKAYLVCAVSVLLTAMLITTTSAQAQPWPRHHDGPAGPASLVAFLLNPQVHTALALTPDQQVQWAAVQTAEQNLRTQAETARTNLQALIAAELAKTTPDLVAIEKAVTAEHQAMAAAAAAISGQAIALYATLNTGQQAIVIAAAQARHQHLSSQHGQTKLL